MADISFKVVAIITLAFLAYAIYSIGDDHPWIKNGIPMIEIKFAENNG